MRHRPHSPLLRSTAALHGMPPTLSVNGLVHCLDRCLPCTQGRLCHISFSSAALAPPTAMARGVLGAKRKSIDSAVARSATSNNSRNGLPPHKRPVTSLPPADPHDDAVEAEAGEEDEFMALKADLSKRGAHSQPAVRQPAAQQKKKPAVPQRSGTTAAAHQSRGRSSAQTLFDEGEDESEAESGGRAEVDDDSADDEEDEDGMRMRTDEDEEEDEERAELPIERKARLLDRRQESEARHSEAELQTNIVDGERFHLPTDVELEEERKAGMDNSQLLVRINDIVGVLSRFRSSAEAGRSRSEYLTQLTSDLCAYFSYIPDLITLFLDLFSPSECLEFLEANETQRPLTIRANSLKTRRRDLAQSLINRGVNLDPIGEVSHMTRSMHDAAHSEHDDSQRITVSLAQAAD